MLSQWDELNEGYPNISLKELKKITCRSNMYDYMGCPPQTSTWHSHSSGPEIPCLLQNPLLCSAS